MKTLIVALAVIALIAGVICSAIAGELFAIASADGWLGLSEDKKEGFILVLAREYLRQNPGCDGVKIDVEIRDDNAYFYTTCLTKPKVMI